jgi:small-conductance mechanosensitive channel
VSGIAGESQTTSRGVTVGKSIGAVLLLLLGYRLLTFLTRRSEGLLMRRFQLGQEQAGTLRRWTNAFGLLALLLLTLNLAQIPLTVFAFAGGALAIGIGFGTQTLIKNLISGMIVLVERNIRVGVPDRPRRPRAPERPRRRAAGRGGVSGRAPRRGRR